MAVIGHHKIEPFETFLNNTFSKIKVSKKAFHIAGNFNLNLIDHDINTKMENFLNIVYQKWYDPNY